MSWTLPQTSRATLREASRPTLPRPAPLTERERDVLDCILKGRSTAQMARTLGIRESTARTHVRNVLDKLGVRSRLAAAAVVAGHPVEPQDPAPRLGAGLRELLTDREADVLRGLLAGLPRKAIAEQLDISPSTVRAHVSSITHKLGCPSALTAVARVRQWPMQPGA